MPAHQTQTMTPPHTPSPAMLAAEAKLAEIGAKGDANPVTTDDVREISHYLSVIGDEVYRAIKRRDPPEIEHALELVGLQTRLVRAHTVAMIDQQVRCFEELRDAIARSARMDADANPDRL